MHPCEEGITSILKIEKVSPRYIKALGQDFAVNNFQSLDSVSLKFMPFLC